MDAPGLRLESIFGYCERHALLHMAPKWFDHWKIMYLTELYAVDKILIFIVLRANTMLA